MGEHSERHKSEDETQKSSGAVKFDWDRTTIELPYGLRIQLKKERDENRSSYAKLIDAMLKEHVAIKNLCDPSKPSHSAIDDVIYILDYLVRHQEQIKNGKICVIIERWKASKKKRVASAE